MTTVQSAEVQSDSAAPAPTAPTAPKPGLKGLFEAYAKLDKEHDDLNAKRLAIESKRSVAVKSILDHYGKGPFKFNGDELTISSRGDTCFFRGKKKDREVIEVG